jgi:hypothetical protein
MQISRLIAGGQTGVDRAALDVAIELSLAHGGWVPRGRLAENGPLGAAYQVKETPSAEPAQRTEWNVRDSDATLILSRGPLTGGSALTQRLAIQYGRPVLHLDLATLTLPDAVDRIKAWLSSLQASTLNVAGPRASEDADIYACTKKVLVHVLTE